MALRTNEIVKRVREKLAAARRNDVDACVMATLEVLDEDQFLYLIDPKDKP